jgi:hypothetical protein
MIDPAGSSVGGRVLESSTWPVLKEKSILKSMPKCHVYRPILIQLPLTSQIPSHPSGTQKLKIEVPTVL